MDNDECPSCASDRKWIVHDAIMDEDICVICGFNLTTGEYDKIDIDAKIERRNVFSINHKRWKELYYEKDKRMVYRPES